METKLFKKRLDGKVQRTTVHIDEVTGRYRTITCQCEKEHYEVMWNGLTQKCVRFTPIQSSEVISEWTYPEPKNVGKKNETTVRSQGQAEVKSKITKMLDSGYVEDLDNIDNPRITKIAMLAKGFDAERVQKEIEKTGYVYTQPKLDGVRCIATAQGLFTRSGKRIVSVPHIDEDLKSHFEKDPDLIFDGELYNHDLRDNFDEIISAVRKEANLDPEQARKIQYHVYDIVSETRNFGERCEGFSAQAFSESEKPSQYWDIGLNIRKVMWWKEDNIDQVFKSHQQWLKEGYEGTMIRYDAPYQLNKRNWNLQKLKEFQDDEFPILRIEEGKGKNAGLASVIVVDVDGVEASPTMMGSLEFRKQLWEEREDYQGGVATVKYFNKTKDGSLRFPNCKMVFKKERNL